MEALKAYEEKLWPQFWLLTGYIGGGLEREGRGEVKLLKAAGRNPAPQFDETIGDVDAACKILREELDRETKA